MSAPEMITIPWYLYCFAAGVRKKAAQKVFRLNFRGADFPWLSYFSCVGARIARFSRRRRIVLPACTRVVQQCQAVVRDTRRLESLNTKTGRPMRPRPDFPMIHGLGPCIGRALCTVRTVEPR